jgi:hypothetical protein
VAGHEQEAAEDERGDDLPAADAIARAIAPRQRDCEQHAACDEMAHGHRKKRRQVANHDRERDERRAPDDVHRRECEPDPHAVSRSHDCDPADSTIISSSPLAALNDQPY